MSFLTVRRSALVSVTLGGMACTSILGQFETDSGGGGGGGGGGPVPACLSPSDCPLGDLDSTCAKAECIDGVCTTTNQPKGSECSAAQRCDGAGQCVDCFENKDCEKGNCFEGACSEKDLGKACGTAKECFSGFCAKNVCCNAECGGACESCGEADGTGQCVVAPLGTLGTPACAPFLCNGAVGTCPNSCTLDTECVDGRFCLLQTMTCELKKVNGDACGADAMCTSGDCYKSACCTPGCECGSCSTGQCVVTLAVGTDPALECGTGTCDGLVGCTTKGALVYALGATLGINAKGVTMRAFDVATDAAGGTVVVGEFAGAISFAGKAFTAVGGTDGFVLKLDPKGNLEWFAPMTQSSALGNQSATTVSIDPKGEILVAGTYTVGLKLGNVEFKPGGARDMFLARFAANGALVAASVVVGAEPLATVTPVGIETTSAGNVVVAGNFSGKAFLDGANSLTASLTDGFVLLADAKFVGQKGIRIGGAKIDQIEALAILKDTLYVTGSFASLGTDGFAFGGNQLGSAGDLDIFVASVTVGPSTLKEGKVASFGSTGIDRGRGIVVSSAGRVYVTGSKTGGVLFTGAASTPPTVSQNGDPFLVSLSSTFVHEWTQSPPTTLAGCCADSGRAVAVDSKGFVLGGGDFSGSLALKTLFVLTSEGGSIDPYIAKYHPGSGGQLLGTPVWGTAGQGSSGSDELTAIATTPERDVIAVGNYRGALIVAGQALPASSVNDPSMFVVRLRQ